MTVGAGITVSDGKLNVLGNTLLTDLHDNIVVTPDAGDGFVNGAFLGVQSDQTGSRLVFPIGKLQFMFKASWMNQEDIGEVIGNYWDSKSQNITVLLESTTEKLRSWSRTTCGNVCRQTWELQTKLHRLLDVRQTQEVTPEVRKPSDIF